MQIESATELRRILDTTVKHKRALTALGVPTQEWDHVLVYLINDRLDSETRKQWELAATSRKFPTFEEIRIFLDKRCRALENSDNNSIRQRSNQGAIKFSTQTKAHSAITVKCPVCSESHHVYQCEGFKQQDVKQRYAIVKEAGLCVNCLRDSHVKKDCKSTSNCKNCNKRHNTLLHMIAHQEPIATIPTNNMVITTIQQGEATVANALTHNKLYTVLLATAIVDVIDQTGISHQARVLLDNGSQTSFVTEAFIQRTRIPRSHGRLHVLGLGQNQTGVTRGVTHLTLKSRVQDFKLQVTTYILPRLVGYLPNQTINSDPAFYVTTD